MYHANITRAEAQHRSKLLTAKSYEVTVDLTGKRPDGSALKEPEAQFVSTSTVVFEMLSDAANDINLIADEIISATLDGQPLDLATYADYKFPFTATRGEHTLSITSVMRYSRTGEGLHRFVDPADDRIYLYTQFESADARRMFANFEQPDQKATFQFTVIAPENWQVVSNTDHAGAEAVGNGFAKFIFAPTLQMSTYITALVAGEYHRVDSSYEAKAGTIGMGILCRQSLKEHLDADKIWETTKRGFEVFEEAFGHEYPFGKYDQSFVPEFNAGAMENAGCVTHRDEYIFRSRVTAAALESRDNTILHELCHMWFGDLVTMKWWDDLWLNESFAEWGSHFAQQKIAAKYNTDVDAWASFCNGRKNWAYNQDQLPTTHPIAADMVDLEAVELNFDGITYAKGASALRQLVAFVGEKEFLTGVRAYFAKHAFKNTELSDLLSELTAASGRDLSRYTSEWLGQSGVNTLRADFDIDSEGCFTRFSVAQSAIEQYPQLRQHRLAIGLYNMVDGKLACTESIECDIDGANTELPQLVGKKRPALLLLNDGDLTYTKIRLDDQSLATLIAHIKDLDSRLARALCWGAAWDMTRDGEMDAKDYISLVLAGIGNEDDMTAVSAHSGAAITAATNFLPAEQHTAAREQLTHGFAELLNAAAPGSDKQLIFVKAMATAANTDAASANIAAWLRGEDAPEGLILDTDLRWNLLASLAAQGKASDNMIDEMAANDKTITGAEWAALVRAARPTAAAKAEAWQVAAEDPQTPNETQRKVAVAFHQPGQEELLAPYVDQYFALVEKISNKEGIWETRSQAIAHAAVVCLFPKNRTQEILDRVDAWMDGKKFSDQVTRQLAEQRDALRRALACQKAAR
ncbi:MAG: aminopeptidase N [Propionibacteriaceae bacterium]